MVGPPYKIIWSSSVTVWSIIVNKMPFPSNSIFYLKNQRTIQVITSIQSIQTLSNLQAALMVTIEIYTVGSTNKIKYSGKFTLIFIELFLTGIM